MEPVARGCHEERVLPWACRRDGEMPSIPPAQLESGRLELTCHGDWPQACLQGPLSIRTRHKGFSCAQWQPFKPVSLRGGPFVSEGALGSTLHQWLCPEGQWLHPLPWGRSPGTLGRMRGNDTSTYNAHLPPRPDPLGYLHPRITWLMPPPPLLLFRLYTPWPNTPCSCFLPFLGAQGSAQMSPPKESLPWAPGCPVFLYQGLLDYISTCGSSPL